MTNKADQKISVLGEKITYKVRTSEKASRARIDVDIRGIRVTIPQKSEKNPENLILDNANWVLEKKRKFEEYRDSAPDRDFEEGAMFPFLGKPKELKKGEKTKVTSKKIILSEVENSSWKEKLEEFYRNQAEQIFKEKTESYVDEMGISYEGITIRNQRTRWGSCSKRRHLNFNWRLVMAPEEIVEYVVVHELTHLREKNHTKRFWRLVKEYIPNYKEKVEWLNDNSPKLIFTEDDL